MKRYENIAHFHCFNSDITFFQKEFYIELSNSSCTVGTEEEAIPCAAQHHTGATTDTRK